MFLFLLFFLALAGAGLHVRYAREAMTPRQKAELMLGWLLVGFVGVGGLAGFCGHLFAPNWIAQTSGWPEGTPFQAELGFANLALGVLGLGCLNLKGEFRLATGIAASIFYLGGAVVHVKAAVAAQVILPGTAGALLPQLLVPVLLPALLIVGEQLRRAELDPWLNQPGLNLKSVTPQERGQCLFPTRPISTWSSTPSPTSGSVSAS